MTTQILSGRHLVKPLKGIASPFVEIEVCGSENDSQRYKTATISDNGLNPIWLDNAPTHRPEVRTCGAFSLSING